MEINFECKKCGNIFDCDVGKVTLPDNSFRPHFEKNIICPTCGQCTMDEVFLTELGQSQLTQATMDFKSNVFFDPGDDNFEDYGFFEGECQGCDDFKPLNDLSLCEECDRKLDRDLIRQRDWAYSMTAFGVPESKLEYLRNEVIKQYGEKLELIAPKDEKQKKEKKKKRKKKRSGKRR